MPYEPAELHLQSAAFLCGRKVSHKLGNISLFVAGIQKNPSRNLRPENF